MLGRYQVIMKMETLDRDTRYVKDLVGLDIKVEVVARQVMDGHTNVNR